MVVTEEAEAEDEVVEVATETSDPVGSVELLPELPTTVARPEDSVRLLSLRPHPERPLLGSVDLPLSRVEETLGGKYVDVSTLGSSLRSPRLLFLTFVLVFFW